MTPSKTSISLSQNKAAAINASDYKIVSRYRWYVTAQGYAATRVDGKSVTMHRLLMKAPKGMDVDHIDRDKLNNRRKNLRVCTRSQNNMNLPPRRDNKTGSKGVRWDAVRLVYRVRIKINGKSKYLGCHKSLGSASRAYNEAAIENFGQFARLNKVTA